MPAANPRITIVVTPRVHAALTRFSAITGKSKSSMVGEILDESVPMFIKMIRVFEAAKLAEKDMASMVVSPFEKAQSHLEDQLGLALEGVDAAAEDLLLHVESVGRRKTGRKVASGIAPGGRATGQRPAVSVGSPLSNRGGRYPGKPSAQTPKPLTRKGKGAK